MSRNAGFDSRCPALVGMAPKVAHIPFATDAQLLEVNGKHCRGITAVEQSHHPVAVREGSIPHFVATLAEFVAEGLAHKAVLAQLQQFAIGIEREVLANG